MKILKIVMHRFFIPFRWLVSQSGENEGSFSNFDQVILPSSVPVNTWNHLVVTLALPQNLAQPHTATVCNFLMDF